MKNDWISQSKNKAWMYDVVSWNNNGKMWNLVKNRPDDDKIKSYVKNRLIELATKYPQYLKLDEFGIT